MQDLKIKAISTSTNVPRLQRCYVDDAFVIKRQHTKTSSQNTPTPLTPTQFTTEDTRPDGLIPFSDILFTLEPDSTLPTTVYMKHTHTD